MMPECIRSCIGTAGIDSYSGMFGRYIRSCSSKVAGIGLNSKAAADTEDIAGIEDIEDTVGTANRNRCCTSDFLHSWLSTEMLYYLSSMN